MPIYEYRCENCDKKFEALVFADSEISCPSCASQKLARIFSTFSSQSGSGGDFDFSGAGASSKCSGCSSGGSCPPGCK